MSYMDPKYIERVLTAPAIDLEPVQPPKEEVESWGPEKYAYIQGYRDAIYHAREFFANKQHPLLICASCNNTESTAGAMARAFNQGRCICGGYFKVLKA